MDALTAIKANLDVHTLLKSLGFDVKYKDGTFVRSCCELHGGNNPSAFVINTETGLWYCHTGGCGAGDAFTLVQKKQNLSFKQAVLWLADFTSTDIETLEIIERQQAHLDEIKKFMQVMRTRKAINTPEEFHIKEAIRPVVSFRNFQPDTLRYFQLGYVGQVELKKRNGDTYKLLNRLVIPNYMHSAQIMLSFRSTKAGDVPKWSHQPPNVEAGHLLYNYDIARYEKSIVVVEGIFDVWAYHEIGIRAVATYGAHLTDEQYKLLLRTGADIILSYDNDDAGNKARDKALTLFKNKANLYVVELPPNKDPENITREELRQAYDKKRRT